MTREEKDALLLSVADSVKEDPEFLSEIISACVAGVRSEITVQRNRASDMESIGCAAFGILASEGKTTKRTKEYFESLVLSKLEKYDFKTSFNWEHLVEAQAGEEE